MSDVVIRAENLGKKYKIQHQQPRQQYVSLRDVIAHRAKSLFRKSPLSIVNSQLTEDFWALKDVNFEIKQGEVVGIIGRNGAGKSTLLKILSRITEPTVGHVGIKGRVASLLEVGTGFHPELTGRENIYLNGAILGMSREEIKRKFDEIVDFAEIEQFLDTPVKRYSSGMYVRLAFAVAAYLEPEILIVDEVLAVGDAEFQKKCLGKMDRVARQGRTVFFVSHNMESIRRLCTSVTQLSNGQVVKAGEPHEVISNYIHRDLNVEAIAELTDDLHLIKSCLQIRKVEVLNSLGCQSAAMLLGEDILVRLTIQTMEPVKQACIGIGIQTDGVRVATIHTPSMDFPSSLQGKVLTCKIPGNTLLPNSYTLHVGAHSPATGSSLDWVADAISFRIEPVSIDNAREYSSKELGLIRLAAFWESSVS